MKSAIAKGRGYEAQIAELFTNAGFEVITNPKSARPRQTDLIVRDGAVDFLIEVKNQAKKIDSGDIDSLRSRLARVSHDVVGIIVTKSTLTDSAVAVIEADRSREILVFINDEVENICSRWQNVRALIERKRTAFRIQGKVWFSTKRDLEFSKIRLPSGNLEFRINEATIPYFEMRSGFAGAIYALEIPDTGWGSFAGEGARLSIQLALSSIPELRNVLGYLHKKFGLSRNGVFSIQQTECCWQGSGAEEFASAVHNWKDRYKKSSSKRLHHSEEVRYFDQIRNGWVELSAQQRVWVEQSREAMLHQSELVIQMPGIPVDASPFVKLCQYVGNEWAEFQYFSHRMTVRKRLKRTLPIKMVGRITRKADNDEGLPLKCPVVVGVIGRNPFYKRKSLPDELEASEIPLAELAETELLICSLRDWHDDGDLVDRYDLQGIEATVGGCGAILRPFGTWNKMLKKISRTG
jgi:Holliday junction resolvase